MAAPRRERLAAAGSIRTESDFVYQPVQALPWCVASNRGVRSGEMVCQYGSTPETVALAAELQALMDQSTDPMEQAESVVRKARRALASRHVTFNARQQGCLERLEAATRPSCTFSDREFVIQHSLKGLKAALLDEDHPDRVAAGEEGARQRQADNEAHATAVRLLCLELKQTDEVLKALGQKIFAERKLTPATAQKLLKPLRSRLENVVYQNLLGEIQSRPSAYKSERGKESFYDGVVLGVAQHSIATPHLVEYDPSRM
eukprot:CAMPEP_0119073324 /NCGR_PEP_ID=MMETSP1178-20130426/64179_1 /TAXON_ID=33656 /ORGANISM="unid sp, Strain CCMP2000" /LENGTH=259 /DNA_ID=CAMNT_0007055391 /DNA_START=11 /DNA_END=790 /DNA_ORIENTATION=+